MASLKEKIYWKMPFFCKNWMASWNARRLNRERFGPDYDRALQEIAEHDNWSAEQFVDYQRRELCSLIRHAAKNVPYYRKQFTEAGIRPDSICGPEDLRHLPILEKRTVQAEPPAFLDETLSKRQLVTLYTSGTTGTPLTIYRDVRLYSAGFAYLDARWHAVSGMRRRVNRSVSLGGHLITAPNRNRPPFWVYNKRWKQLYMSSYRLSPKYLDYYVDELRNFNGEYIEGYPSSIYAVAQYIVDKKLEPIPFKACFTTAETLFDHQRQMISEAFCCRTYNQYGCGEQVVFAAECENGSMHLSPEIGIVEVLDDNDKPVQPGKIGQLVCTSLINRVQPFIRYRLNDIASLLPGRCSCGSSLPMLGHIEGRVDAVLITRDGRKIGRLDPVFKGAKGIAEAQIVQNDYDKFVIRIVPGNDYSASDGQNVIQNLGNRVGEADIRIEIVGRIERTSAGKFKAVVCNLPKERAC